MGARSEGLVNDDLADCCSAVTRRGCGRHGGFVIFMHAQESTRKGVEGGARRFKIK
jgi:hypothetical protein